MNKREGADVTDHPSTRDHSNLHEVLQLILTQIDEAHYADIPELLDGMAAAVSYRKSSKVLGTHLMLDVIQINDMRSVVLTACLYFEHIVLVNPNRDAARKRPLAVELERLCEQGSISRALLENMRAIVSLRNAFAHELYYDAAGWDPTSAPYLAGRSLRIPKRPHLRRAKHLALAKILLMLIIDRLHQELPWLSLEDVPKGKRTRSNKSLHPTARAPSAARGDLPPSLASSVHGDATCIRTFCARLRCVGVR